MNAYQRGNRDACLAVAARLTEAANAEDKAAARFGLLPLVGSSAERGQHAHWQRANALLDAAERVRRMAEAMPEDPEEAQP